MSGWRGGGEGTTQNLKTTPAAQTAKPQLTAFSVSPLRLHICKSGF